MNPETAREDVLALRPGAAVIYDEPLKLDEVRDDLVFYPVPFDELVAPICPDAKLRRLVRNMIYDGVLSRLLGIEMAEMEKALGRQLGEEGQGGGAQPGRARGRVRVRRAAACPKRDPFRVERMDETRGKILIEGNAAVAIGAMMAGVTVVTWYPITPSSTVCETLIDYMKKYRMDQETGKATFAIVQAEDELASHRHGARRRVGRRAVDDGHLRARHLADGGVHRPRLLRRGAGGHRRRAARRAVHRPADAHGAGRHPVDGGPLARRHEAHPCCIPARPRSATR